MKTSLLLAFAFFCSAAQAQTRMRSTTEGLTLGAHAHGFGWSSNYFQFLDENAGSGFGGEIRAGYGLSQRYEPFVSYAFTSMPTAQIDAESFRFSHLDLGMRFNFSATTRRLRPFAEAGYSLVTSRATSLLNGNGGYSDFTMKGGGFRAGLGTHYFVSLPVALTLQVGGTFGGRFRNLTIDGDLTPDQPDFSSFRVSLGLTVFLREL